MRLLYLLLILTTQIVSQNGVVKSYFMDGSVEAEQTYIRDILDGPSVYYYPNGNIKTIMNYSEGKVNGWVRNYYDTGLLESEYFVNNGVRDGSTRLYYGNGGLKSVIVYKRGRFMGKDDIPFDGNFIASADDYAAGNKQYAKLKNDDRILCDTEICPAPIGGMDAIKKNTIYTEKARLYGLEGTVTIAATISSKGQILRADVIKGLGLGLDEAAVNAIKTTGFLPGKNNNQSVLSNVTIKVEFALDEADKQFIASADEIAGEIPEVVEYDDINQSFDEPEKPDYSPVFEGPVIEKENKNIAVIDNIEYEVSKPYDYEEKKEEEEPIINEEKIITEPVTEEVTPPLITKKEEPIEGKTIIEDKPEIQDVPKVEQEFIKPEPEKIEPEKKELPTITEIVRNKIEEEKLKPSEDNLDYNIQINNYRNFDCDVQECPTPIGGTNKINENLVTPKVAFRKDIKGDVVMIARIDRYGYVRNTRVVQKLGYGIDEAAEVAVLDTKFNPARENGVNVSCEMIIVVPIRK